MKGAQAMDELKPCPFCGGKAMLIANRYRHEQTSFFVKCSNEECEVIPETYENEIIDFVIKAWNRRAEDG